MLSHYPHRRKRKQRRLSLLLTQHIILLSIEDEDLLKGFYNQFIITCTDPNDPYYPSFIIFYFVQIASSKSPQYEFFLNNFSYEICKKNYKQILILNSCENNANYILFRKLEQSNLRLSPNKVNLLSPGSNNDVQSFHDLHSRKN